MTASPRRFAAKVDTTQAPIVAALRGVGALVWPVNKELDLVVQFRGKTYVMDCKTAKGGLTDEQKKMVDAGWIVAFPRSVDEALTVIGAVKR